MAPEDTSLQKQVPGLPRHGGREASLALPGSPTSGGEAEVSEDPVKQPQRVLLGGLTVQGSKETEGKAAGQWKER